jgi:ABC-2 type transport system permease protein
LRPRHCNTPLLSPCLLFLGSAFVPAATMPIVLREFATYQSLTPATATVRGLLTDTPIGQNAIAAFAWSIGIALAVYLWLVHLYTHCRPR